MRPLTEDESKAVFEKLANYIGKNLVHLVDRQDEAHCFRLQKGRVYYVSEASMRLSISVARSNLVSLGTCLGKFSKSGTFKLHITSLDYLAQYAKYKVWVKPNGEMPFLYGNHVLKAHLGRITEDTPEHQGVVVYSMNDVPLVGDFEFYTICCFFQCLFLQGFGVTSRSTVDTRKLDPTAILVFHQAEQDLRQQWIDLSDDELNTSNINDVLNAITDDLWVVAAVADRIIDDPTSLYDLLGIALKRSEGTVERLQNSLALQDDDQELSGLGGQGSSSDEDDDNIVSYFHENPSDARISLLRSALLDRRDRLDTFVEMSSAIVTARGGSETPAEWDDDPWVDTEDVETTDQPPSQGPLPFPLSTFLSRNLVDTACLLATRESFSPLQILFKRHGPSIWPHRFIILSCIPTHVSPSYYLEILPKLDISRDVEQQSPAEAWRPELDWTEHPTVQAALSPPVATFRRLASWYRQRTQTILSSTGMVDVALSMAQHATSRGIPGLDALGEELSLLSRAAEDGPEDDWTLEQWENMDSLAVVRAMLAFSTPETLVADIRKLVLPYLFVLESRAERAGDPNSDISLQLLNDFILGSPLEMVARIFEESKPTIPSGRRLIQNDEDIVRLALACLYGSNSLDEWHTMSQIFECLPAWNGASGDEDSGDAVEMTIASLGSPKCTPSDLFLFFRPLPLPSLSRALDILDVHLEWDAPAPLRWFLQSANDKSGQRARAVRMDDWEWLLEDMLKLCRTNDNGLRSAFGLLSQAEILSIFLSGLLSTGQLDIARRLLRSKQSALSFDDRAIEEICLASSREFYDNASSGNYKFGDMKLAYDCLSIPSRSETVVREQQFIEATSRITSFNVETRPGGVPLSPIEIRLTKDRLSLVSRVLSSNSDAYKYNQVILELVDKLGFRGQAVPRVKALAMIADAALQAEDFVHAFETSEAMINTVSQLCSSSDAPQAELDDAKEVCWVSFPDVPKKLRLLGHALEFCPADRLPEILAAWRRLEKEDVAQHVGEEGVPSPHRHGRARTRAGQPPGAPAPSLASRLQNIHLPASPLPRRFQASLLQDSPAGTSRSVRGRDGQGHVSAQASRAFQRGIGWLIGADE
ncbi:secretory pathway protein Sec39-domain-containing protein [Russula brevipes]|nr:secretory pathway protein Sec39-domain-containing protein [Russula brevipes]